MTIDLTGAQVFLLIFNILLLCLAFFIRQWMSRQQADIDSCKKKNEAVEKVLHEYMLQCSRDYALRTEVSSGRTEMMDAITHVSQKVDRIYEKLVPKAEK